MAYAATTASEKKRAPKLDASLARLAEYEQSGNIAELLEKDQLEKIGYDVEREYRIDKQSRSDWEASAERAMEIALQVRKPKHYPFENAANIKYPLVTVAALQFGARAYPAIVDGNRIVKAQVLGRDDGTPVMGQDGQPVVDPQTGQPQWQVPPGAKRAKAERVSEHMSYQLMCEMEEWEEDTDVLLHHLPIVGCAFRKVWRSDELQRSKAEMVPAIHLVVNNKVRSLDGAPRVTHELFLYPQEIEERKRNGTFLDVELPAPQAADAADDDAPHMLLEQHRYLDLDNDGYREPYIVTIHKESCQVLRIVANYTMERVQHDSKKIIRIPKEQYFVKYSFIPDPRGGFYDIGFGKLLESLSETIDTTINQMLDAGHLQNAGGGFIGAGIRLKKNTIRIAPGRYEQVETSGNLRDQIHNHQHPGPSAVLFNLLGMMVEAARDITAVKDILTGDSGNKGVQTATTTLAMIEQGLKVFTAIYKRVYRAMKDEFKLLFELNSRYLSDQEYYTFLDEEQVIARGDYDLGSLDIVPVSDPKMVTDMQRTARAQVLMQIVESPALGGLINTEEALRRVFDAVGMEEVDRLIVVKQGPTPQEELMMADALAEVKQKEARAAKDIASADQIQIETQAAQAGDPGKDRLDEAKAQAAEHAAQVKMVTAEHGARVQSEAASHAVALDAENKERDLMHKERLRQIKLQEADDKAARKAEPVE